MAFIEIVEGSETKHGLRFSQTKIILEVHGHIYVAEVSIELGFHILICEEHAQAKAPTGSIVINPFFGRKRGQWAASQHYKQEFDRFGAHRLRIIALLL